MGALHPVVLEARCPAEDDPVILELLRVVTATSGASWAELEVRSEQTDKVCRFGIGRTHGQELSLQIALGGGYEATLRVGGPGPVPEPLARLLGLSLTRVLECNRLREQTALLRGALDATSSSVLLFDSRGDIVFANPPADRLLSLQTEEKLLAETNGTPRQPLFTLLCSLVDQVADAEGVSASWKGTLNLDDSRIMVCEVMRVRNADDRAPAAVLAILQEVGAGSEARVDAFAANHGFSPREHEVVHLLVQGLTTLAIADTMSISTHTVRDHIKHLYRKTGTRSRSELLGLIAGATQQAAAKRGNP
jgi:DNA-binding CsgD family transcriptional regulator/PAS domain-containing protein